MSQNLNNFVQDYRNNKKVTQEDLAKSVGVTRQTIIATGKRYCMNSIALRFVPDEYLESIQ